MDMNGVLLVLRMIAAGAATSMPGHPVKKLGILGRTVAAGPAWQPR